MGKVPKEHFEAHKIAINEATKLSQTSDYEKLNKLVDGWKQQNKVVQKYLIVQLAQQLDSPKPLKLDILPAGENVRF